METRAASNGNSGRVAYIFVVAVVGIMLIVSALAGVIRLKEAFFAIIQGQAETTESGAEAATSAKGRVTESPLSMPGSIDRQRNRTAANAV